MKWCTLLLIFTVLANCVYCQLDYFDFLDSKTEFKSSAIKSAKSGKKLNDKDVGDEDFDYDQFDSHKDPTLSDAPENRDNDEEEDIKQGPIYDINQAPDLFEKFIKDYSKEYKDAADKEEHYQVFVTNLKEINRLNAVPSSAVFDINRFSDMSDIEFASLLG